MDTILQILGFIVGLLYLWYEYHASSRLWIISVIMPMISLWLYLRKGLYADFAINIYYLIIAVYGYITWRSGKKAAAQVDQADQANSGRPITHIPLWAVAAGIAATALLWYVMGWILDNRTDSTVPWYDAFTTALSIVGMWLLARKYAEQWIAWIIVDAVCVWLYAYKGIPLYALLYLIYTVIAIFGYRKWLRLMHTQS